MAAKSDHYDILGIAKNASQDEIKKAYRKQALEWHPDKHKENKEAAEKRFKEINEAYQILSDTEKRRAYDQFGHAAFSPGQAPGRRGPSSQAGRWGPFTYTYTSTGGGAPFAGFDFGDPFEIFAEFFGGASPFRQRRAPRYSITIDFMDAIKGVEKELEIQGGKRKIKIPGGVDEGSRIMFDNFILSINIKPHEIFERDGADILVKAWIPYSLAVLGGEHKVPTIDGNIKIRIRKGTQPNTIIRLRGKGAPRLRGHGHGDQYIKINIMVPEKLTKKQKKLIETMENESL